MLSRFAAVAVVSACLVVWPASALAGGHGTIKQFGPGAAGIGDPYFPLAGNGGYDVKHYDLDLAYQPSTDVLRGVATIRARATQNLSRFNLDFNGMTVRSIRVDGRRATWSRADDELTVTPRKRLPKRERFTTVVAYDGVPEPVGNSQIGFSGFIPTDDGTSSPASPRWPIPGTPSTTTRSTRRPTRSTSRFPRASWRCPTAS